MKKNKKIAVFLLIVISISCLVPSFAGAAERENSGFETFLSVLKVWGTFLAKVTGSYDTLNNISLFSNFAKIWHDLIESDGFSVEKLLEAILSWIGVDGFLQEKNTPAGSYSI